MISQPYRLNRRWARSARRSSWISSKMSGTGLPLMRFGFAGSDHNGDGVWRGNRGFGKGSFTFLRHGQGMRMHLALLGTLLMAGCNTTPALVAAPVVAGVGVGSIAVLGRSPVDAVYSLATGK